MNSGNKITATRTKPTEVRAPEYEARLPSNWKLAKFDDVAYVTDYVANGSFASLKQNVTYRSEPDYAVLVRLTDFTNRWEGKFVYVDKHAYEFLHKSSLEPGDIVIANVGDPGRVFRVPNLGRPMTLGPNSVLVRPKDGLDSTYLQYFFKSSWGQNLIARITTGTAQKKFNKTGLRAFYVPVAPSDQQKRIVAEIEKQFSRLDEAVANLKRVKANLKRYKAAVLKAAVEGRLVETEAELARREGRSYETGEQLLQRILETRRSQWQGKRKYKEPAAPDTTDLPELPEGWVWASLDSLSWGSSYGTSEKCSYEGDGPAVLRIPNVQDGMIDLRDLKFASSTLSLSPDTVVDVGDMLIIRTNGSKSLIGKAAVVLASPPKALLYASYLIRFRLMRIGHLPDWISVVWQTPRIRSWIEAHAATSAGQYNVSMTVLATAAVPLPPLAEQHHIVAEVDRCLSLLLETEAQVEADFQRAERLRQSILEKAFSGQLIPEDPNAEPASVLLERIQIEAEPKPARKAHKASIAKQIPKEVTVADLIEVLSNAGDWISAQDVFRRCGAGDGADTDTVERLYAKLREYVRSGSVEVERRGKEDWLRFSPGKGA